MAGPPNPSSRRLDSWKAIADYLGRDVRTAMRWAKTQGLPVGRVAGGKGRSVFAYTDEIDAWLTGHREEERVPPPPAPPTPPALAPPLAAPRMPVIRWATVAVVVFLALVAAIMAPIGTTEEIAGWDLRIDKRGVHRVPVDGGDARLLFSFANYPGAVPLVRTTTESVHDLESDGESDLLTAIVTEERLDTRTVQSGRLFRLTEGGDVRWQHHVTDAVAFTNERFTGPWALTDWRVSPPGQPRRIAFVAHHYMWWPSVVGLLTPDGGRAGTFVNAGWVEGLRWIDPDRLVIAGFSNARDGAMVALLDGRELNGSSPDEGAFACRSCPDGRPLTYVILPRSELNTLTASRFNRAVAEVAEDTILVQTQELGETVAGATAVYEFDLNLQLRGAKYSDQYWDAHRKLEVEGRIDHPRASCPHRDGPHSIQVWTPERGWQTKRLGAPGTP